MVASEPAPPEPRASVVATAGDTVRRGRKRLAGLPGLTLTADTIAARHCVDLLAAGVKEDPDDPRRHIWLAEAVLRTRRDLKRWARMRAVADPRSLIVRSAVRGIASLGQDAEHDPAEQLLKRAFALAQARVREHDRDPLALHAIARVYLARRMPEDAARLAGLASAAESGERAEVLITGARALKALRRRDEAARLAQGAVDHGSTLGYELLAQLLLIDRAHVKQAPAVHVVDVLELRREVRAEDRARYFGATRSTAEVALAVKSAQWQKLSNTFSDAVNLADRARVAVLKEATP